MISGLGGGFIDRRLGLMVCVCGSVDGLCLCVCGFVVVGLWLKWLVILGFRWVSDGLFFFLPSVVTLVFFFLVWVFVSVGFL